MKRLSLTLALSLLFTGCAASSSSLPDPTPQPQQEEEQTAAPVQEGASVIYRGQVAYVGDWSIEVTQMLPGYNYGYDSIRFLVDENTELISVNGAFQDGAFIEVRWNGILTRSDPPLASADVIEVISDVSDSILINGRITTVAAVDDSYRLIIQPFNRTEERASVEEIEDILEGLDPDEKRDTVVLNVPALALEGGLTMDDLVEGAEICAVTKGIAALSMPPQYPVHALLPFSRGYRDE